MEHPDTLSAAGNKYVMDIIDDYSSYTWSIPLATKSDMFPALRAWEQARELETNLKVGIYRSDNGELKSDTMAPHPRDPASVHGTIHLRS